MAKRSKQDAEGAVHGVATGGTYRAPKIESTAKTTAPAREFRQAEKPADPVARPHRQAAKPVDPVARPYSQPIKPVPPAPTARTERPVVRKEARKTPTSTTSNKRPPTKPRMRFT